MTRTPDRFLAALFCDDIRQEVGDKTSFMGCYREELIIQDGPLPGAAIALPKLCIFVNAFTPIEQPFARLSIRVIQDSATELARLDIPPAQLRPASGSSPSPRRLHQVNAVIAFSPFVVNRSMTLTVIGNTDDGELIGPELYVRVQAPASHRATPTAAKGRSVGKKVATSR